MIDSVVLMCGKKTRVPPANLLLSVLHNIKLTFLLNVWIFESFILKVEVLTKCYRMSTKNSIMRIKRPEKCTVVTFRSKTRILEIVGKAGKSCKM